MGTEMGHDGSVQLGEEWPLRYLDGEPETVLLGRPLI